jgi:hypothetical protein
MAMAGAGADPGARSWPWRVWGECWGVWRIRFRRWALGNCTGARAAAPDARRLRGRRGGLRALHAATPPAGARGPAAHLARGGRSARRPPPPPRAGHAQPRRTTPNGGAKGITLAPRRAGEKGWAAAATEGGCGAAGRDRGRGWPRGRDGLGAWAPPVGAGLSTTRLAGPAAATGNRARGRRRPQRGASWAPAAAGPAGPAAPAAPAAAAAAAAGRAARPRRWARSTPRPSRRRRSTPQSCAACGRCSTLRAAAGGRGVRGR